MNGFQIIRFLFYKTTHPAHELKQSLHGIHILYYQQKQFPCLLKPCLIRLLLNKSQDVAEQGRFKIGRIGFADEVTPDGILFKNNLLKTKLYGQFPYTDGIEQILDLPGYGTKTVV